MVEGRRRCDDLATLGREKGKGMWPCDDYEWSEAGLVHGRAGESKRLLSKGKGPFIVQWSRVGRPFIYSYS